MMRLALVVLAGAFVLGVAVDVARGRLDSEQAARNRAFIREIRRLP